MDKRPSLHHRRLVKLWVKFGECAFTVADAAEYLGMTPAAMRSELHRHNFDRVPSHIANTSLWRLRGMQVIIAKALFVRNGGMVYYE